jgi:hypothetical protein
MLLNRLPCLDKGYVAYLDSSGSSAKLKDIALEFFKKTESGFLSPLATLTVVMKCPLFVQLNLSTHNLQIVTVPPTDVEAYCPHVGDIGAPEHDACVMIANNMAQTTDALLINPKAYQQDGCDRFVSQVLTPISTYTTIIVHGSYDEWRKFCYQNNMPGAIAAYATVLRQIMAAEWK